MYFVVVFRPGAESAENTDADAAGAARVEAHYRSGDLTARESIGMGLVSVHCWLTPADGHGSQWPGLWHSADGRHSAVLPYSPIAFERVVGDVGVPRAAAALPVALMQHPERALHLTPPFTAVLVDRPSRAVRLLTDLAGIGRLYEFRHDGATFFSNRPAAAVLFAGAEPRRSANGWLHLAACDWAMGRSTAYAGVRTLPAGCQVVLTPQREPVVSGTDPAPRWADRADHRAVGWAGVDVDQAAADLVGTFRSVARLWDQEIEVDLTGGRDSRVVAAAALAAGVPIRFHTHDRVPGELEVARALIAAQPRDVEHRVEHLNPADHSPVPPALKNALAWHRYAEGRRPSAYLWAEPPAPGGAPLVVGGAGGELAHQFYYSRNDLQLLGDGAELHNWAVGILARRVIGSGAVGRRAVRATTQRIAQVVAHGLEAGFRDATVLDWSYADERLRNWGTTGERDGVVAPFLTPSFVDAAFATTPADRLADRLHVELLRRLMPAWADIPFFHGDVTRPPRLIRAGEAPDRAALGAVFADVDRWSDAFQPRRIQAAWQASVAGISTRAQELWLRRVIWWASFDDQLASLRSSRLVATPTR